MTASEKVQKQKLRNKMEGYTEDCVKALQGVSRMCHGYARLKDREIELLSNEKSLKKTNVWRKRIGVQ